MSVNLLARFLIFFLLTKLLAMKSFSQEVSVYKMDCTSMYNGQKIKVKVQMADTIFFSDDVGYELNSLRQLDDSIKLKIVYELLTVFRDDTALCCNRVSEYNYSRIDVDHATFKSRRYNIQIDALYMINRLCFPEILERYVNKPVIYDAREKVEINDQPEKIKVLFNKYIRWYHKCKKNKKIAPVFAFNKGRYRWLTNSKAGIYFDDL